MIPTVVELVEPVVVEHAEPEHDFQKSMKDTRITAVQNAGVIYPFFLLLQLSP